MVGQRLSDLGLEIFQRGFGQRQITVTCRVEVKELALVDVMFVFDLADDLFDQILDGHKPVNAAVFINHQRHVPPFRLHFGQQHADGHRRRHEQQRANHVFEDEILAPVPVETIEQRQILEVGKARWRVQRALEHGQTGHAAVLEHLDQFVQRNGAGHRHDVGLGDGHVFHAHTAQVDHAVPVPAAAGRGVGCGAGITVVAVRGAERLEHTREKTAGFRRVGLRGFCACLRLRALRRLRRSVVVIAHRVLIQFKQRDLPIAASMGHQDPICQVFRLLVVP